MDVYWFRPLFSQFKTRMNVVSVASLPSKADWSSETAINKNQNNQSWLGWVIFTRQHFVDFVSRFELATPQSLSNLVRICVKFQKSYEFLIRFWITWITVLLCVHTPTFGAMALKHVMWDLNNLHNFGTCMKRYQAF